MTTKQLYPLIGRSVLVRGDKFMTLCTVQDIKESYGKVRFLVKPVYGAGEGWVESSRLVRYDVDFNSPETPAWRAISLG